MRRELGLTLEEQDGKAGPAAQQLASGRETDDPATNHHHVDRHARAFPPTAADLELYDASSPFVVCN
jgi:hypothetical protein